MDSLVAFAIESDSIVVNVRPVGVQLHGVTFCAICSYCDGGWDIYGGINGGPHGVFIESIESLNDPDWEVV